MNDSELLHKRFVELGRRSYNSGIYTFTDFLGLAERAIFEEARRELTGVSYTEFGGADGTERVMIRFGDEEELGYSEPYPIVCIKAEPQSQKFADKLTHRDFLGALMNLGIERSMLGDIAIIDNVAYFFAHENIADFIVDSLTRVRHTDVKLELVSALPEGELYKTERRRVQAHGERLDAVIAKLFSLSRENSQLLFKRGLVFANGKAIFSTSYIPKPDETISVRGYGRFIYRSYESTTKRGNLNIEVDLYV